MKIVIEECPANEEDSIIVRCKELDERMLQLLHSLKAGKHQLAAWRDGQIVMLELKEAYYFEAVDNRVYIYTQQEVYESRMKLYELEQQYGTADFLRISKSVIVNMTKIRKLSPGFNGRFEAHLKNGERVVISRQYVPALKERLGL